LFVWLIFRGQGAISLSRGELVQLIRSGSTGSIDVHHGTGNKQEHLRFSRLSELEIAPYKISGKLFRTTLDENGNARDDTTRQVEFVTNSSPEMSNELAKLLERERFQGYDVAEGPGFADKWLPLLAITAILGLLAFFMVRRLGGAGSPMAFGRSRGKLYA